MAPPLSEFLSSSLNCSMVSSSSLEGSPLVALAPAAGLWIISYSSLLPDLAFCGRKQQAMTPDLPCFCTHHCSRGWA